eukprot:TRINITY_DN11298_c0_g2_i2.p1 TRINITY_DN11298_c0_g2~~TRINITY_DN11298_c0_g2_i2.p1  ORF type:complete len:1142 (+),score=186.40 TRINITY_DN11298_c0_g2_i2:53-3478(+)
MATTAATLTSNSTSGNRPRQSNGNSMKFSLTVVSGIGLRKTDFFGTPDPFVIVSCGRERYMSEPSRRTLSPVWDQTFHFETSGTSPLHIAVWNWRKYSRKENTGFMGEVKFQLDFLNSARAREVVSKNYPLVCDEGMAGSILVNFEVKRQSLSSASPSASSLAHPKRSPSAPSNLSSSFTSSTLNERSGRSQEFSPISPETASSFTASTRPDMSSIRQLVHRNTQDALLSESRRRSLLELDGTDTTESTTENDDLRPTLSRSTRSQSAGPAVSASLPAPAGRTRRVLPVAGVPSRRAVDDSAIQRPKSPPLRPRTSSAASALPRHRPVPSAGAARRAPPQRSQSMEATTTTTTTSSPSTTTGSASPQRGQRSTSSAGSASRRATNGSQQRPSRSNSGTSSSTSSRGRGRSRGSQDRSSGERSRHSSQARRQQAQRRQMRMMQQLREPLPSGWEARLTPNGKVYYANHLTRTTQWKRPTSPAQPAVETEDTASVLALDMENYERRSLLVTDFNAVSEDDVFGFPDVEEEEETPPISAASSQSAASMTRSVSGLLEANTSSSSSIRPPTSPLQNTESRQSSVDQLDTSNPFSPTNMQESDEQVSSRTSRPDPAPSSQSQASSASAAQTSSSSRNRTSSQEGNASSRPASAGQRQHRSGSRTTGRSGHRSRHKPKSPTNPMDKHWSEFIVEEGLGEFPVGWEQRFTSSGVPYFVDHINRSTTFQDPRLQVQQQRREEALHHEAKLPQYKRDLRRKLLKLRHLFKYQQKQDARKYGTRISSNEWRVESMEIAVSRDNIFEDSYRTIMRMTSPQLRAKLNITFFGEAALDYGGVAREWFFLLSKEMLNPYYGLFQYSSSDAQLLEINPNSAINPDHLSYFKMVGRVLGLAVCHGHYIDGGFVMPLYKHLLGKDITLEDMAHVDETFYNSLKWMLTSDITGIIDNTFSDEYEAFGVIETVDLKPGGSEIPVTEENKHEYVQLIVKHRLNYGIEEQVREMKLGFNEVVPPSFMTMFDEREVELVVCGLGEVDMQDWQKHTEYRHCDVTDDPIKWFWQILQDFETELRARVLQFVTGTSRVPVTGFRDLRGSQGPKLFTIEIVPSASPDSLPKAHTCFNRIDLPKYPDFETMQGKLLQAIENSVGFGLE